MRTQLFQRSLEEFPPPGGGTWSRMGDEPSPARGDQVGEEVVVDDVDDLEADLLHADEELQAQTRDIETQAVVLEHLDNYAIILENLIETDQCTELSGQLLEEGINNELARVDESMTLPALESGTTPAQRHQMALEFLRDWFHRVATGWVVSRKQKNDFWSDLIKSVEVRVGKYRTRLEKGQSEYNHKKDGWQDAVHTGNLVEMWYHFATEHGDAKRLVPEIMKDVKMSSYVLIEYPTKLSALYNKAHSTLAGHKLTDQASGLALGKAVEALPHPASMFDRSLLGGKPFLSVTGLEMDVGSKRKAVTVDGVTFMKLSELASPKKVIESGSWSHTVKKVATYVSDFAAGTKSGPNMTIKFTTEDVGNVISAGFQYLEHVDAYLKLAKQFTNDAGKFDKIFEGYEKSVAEQMQSGREIAAMLRQIQQYLENIEDCFMSPASKEMARSVKGARYCDYMSLRMIYQAR
jgi:hypothetical protein